MNLLVTGVSHKTAAVEVREKLAFAEPTLPAALDALRKTGGIAEALILSTCNRVELAVSAHDEIDTDGMIDAFLEQACGVSLSQLGPQAHRFEGREAIHHLFRVAASLESMVIGEPQILGQMKSAYAVAKGHGALGGLLENVLTKAFQVAKRVRSETGIGQTAVSVSYAAVELARQIFGSLNGRTVMIAGSGKMSQLAARHLRRLGASILVTNRTRERAVELAGLFGGTALDYSRFLQILPEVDILIASSAAPHYILSVDEMQRVISARRNRPVFLIDIAVPRNIDPAVNKIDNVFLYDIDDLNGVVMANIRERQKEADRAEEIINQEVERMMGRLKVREVTPTIVRLQEQLEAVRASETLRLRGKLASLNAEQQDAVDALTRGIINKIAHGPISELRRQAEQPDGGQLIDMIRKVFQLRD